MDDPRRVERMQAVALMTAGDSDRAVFDRVTVVGYQDTLFVDAGRSYFRDCKVVGHVDFIFGAGQAVFENCDIVSRNRANKNPTGYVTAPSTHVAQPYGLLFINSRLLKEDSYLPAGSVRLGRPWHPGAVRTAEGSAVFINCFMDDHIGPEGYAPISAVDSNGIRVWFEVDERSRFFEFGSHGPGGAPSEHRPQLTPGQAEWFTSDQALNGWNPFGQ
jgi:pectinesterase